MRLSFRAKAYRNSSGNWASPVWNEIPNIKDLALNLGKAESDVSRRGTDGWEAMAGTLKQAAIEWGMVWDTADDDFTALRDSYLNNTVLDMMFLDRANVAGAQGFRAEVECMTFNRQEQLKEAIGLEVAVKPGWSENVPQWVTVS